MEEVEIEEGTETCIVCKEEYDEKSILCDYCNKTICKCQIPKNWKDGDMGMCGVCYVTLGVTVVGESEKLSYFRKFRPDDDTINIILKDMGMKSSLARDNLLKEFKSMDRFCNREKELTLDLTNYMSETGRTPYFESCKSMIDSVLRQAFPGNNDLKNIAGSLSWERIRRVVVIGSEKRSVEPFCEIRKDKRIKDEIFIRDEDLRRYVRVVEKQEGMLKYKETQSHREFILALLIFKFRRLSEKHLPSVGNLPRVSEVVSEESVDNPPTGSVEEIVDNKVFNCAITICSLGNNITHASQSDPGVNQSLISEYDWNEVIRNRRSVRQFVVVMNRILDSNPLKFICDGIKLGRDDVSFPFGISVQDEDLKGLKDCDDFEEYYDKRTRVNKRKREVIEVTEAEEQELAETESVRKKRKID